MKHPKIYTIVMLVLSMVLTSGVFAQTPVTIVNHSFELPGGSGVINNWNLIPGWDSDRKSWITDEDLSSDGDWNAWCGRRGKYVEQVTSHTLLSGKLYSLKFDTCSWDPIGINLIMEAVADDTDTVLATFDEIIPQYPNWTEKELQFTANGHVGETLRIQFKNGSTASNVAGVDNIRVTYSEAETDPPTPNPSTWSQVPTAISANAITMTATAASDPSGGVKYYFEETTGNPDGNDSGWQTDASYTDTGLTAETTYTYRVRTKDAWDNIGLWSTSQSDTTPAAVYPASDPNNTGNWELRGDLSDEFEGASLDTNKWFIDGTDGVYMYDWPGRAPSQFSTANVRLENGMLKLDTRWDPTYDFWPDDDPDCHCPYGDPPITTAAVISKNTFTYGYLEIKCKAADASITSSFWCTGANSELDIFEFLGDSKLIPEMNNYFEFSVHCKKGWTDHVELAWGVADAVHIYGCEWHADGLRFYVDGNLVYDIYKDDVMKNWCLKEPMQIWVDQETMSWHGFPLESELPVDYEIEYIRVWQH